MANTKVKTNYKYHYIIMMLIPSILMILGFIVDSPQNIIKGLYDIVLAPNVLLVDYISVGGLGATLINSSLLMYACILIIYVQKLEITGPLMAGLLTVCGFGFMGKNVLNVIPIFIGGFLYTRYQKIEYKSVILVSLFATTLGPAISFIALGLDFSPLINILLALIIGTIIGFVVPPMTSQMLKIHDGYNLYNIGFTGGMLGLVIAGIFRSLGYPMESQNILSTEYSELLKYLFLFISAILIIIGFFINDKSFKGYRKFNLLSGRLSSNFTALMGYGNTYINMGIMGLISIAYVVIVKGVFNGPVVAGILTVVGFGAFGKHPKNSIPVMLGVLIAGLLTTHNISSTGIVIAGLFGTTLAPITGGYGFVPGVIAGFLHVTMVTQSGMFHGALNLYNNGFSGGIVAAFLVPILNVFVKKKIED